MSKQVVRHEDVLDEALAIADAAWATHAAHLPVPARFILEDHDGYPIECPLCGRVDRWRMERSPLNEPRGFECAHLADGPEGWVRRFAAVSINQVGGYLDLATLIPTAA
jgi:hypothetical protein